MADSIRLAVLKELTTYLETTVSVANGYNHDLLGKVVRGRFLVGPEDPVPLVSFLEGLNPDREPITPGREATEQKDEWVLLIKGVVADDKDNPTDPAHQLLADLKKSLALLNRSIVEDRQLFVSSPLYFAESILVEPGTVRPPTEQTEKAACFLRIVIGLVEPLDDPFFTP